MKTLLLLTTAILSVNLAHAEVPVTATEVIIDATGSPAAFAGGYEVLNDCGRTQSKGYVWLKNPTSIDQEGHSKRDISFEYLFLRKKRDFVTRSFQRRYESKEGTLTIKNVREIITVNKSGRSADELREVSRSSRLAYEGADVQGELLDHDSSANIPVASLLEDDRNPVIRFNGDQCGERLVMTPTTKTLEQVLLEDAQNR